MSYLPREEAGPSSGHRGQHEGPTRRRGLGRALGLTALGTILPGAGLTFTRRRALGWALLTLFLAALAALGAVLVSRGAVRTALGVAVRPNLLMGVMVAVVVVALIWCLSIVLTARQARPTVGRGRQNVVLSVFTGLMCLVVLVPSVQVVRYVTIQRDVLGSVFSGRHQAPSASGVGLAKPDAHAQDPWAGTPRVNVLLLGSDSGPDRTGVRTDSMIVASIDTRTGDTVLFGVPRNLEKVPFPQHDPLSQLWPNGYDCGSQCLMNAVWTMAEQHSDLFPGDSNPGLTATRDALSQILGLSIDYTTIIDLHGFTSLVDAMGGVTVDVKERIPIGGVAKDGQIVPGSIKGWIEAGRQHLDGYHALWFSRSRATTDDFSRMRRQRCMVGALLNQVNPVTMLEKYPKLASVAKDNIQVDIPQDELPAWVELVQRIQHGEIRSLPFTETNTDVVNPDYAKIARMVQAAINPASSHPTTSPPTGSHPTGSAAPNSTPTPSATTPGASPTPSPSSTTAGSDGLVSVQSAC